MDGSDEPIKILEAMLAYSDNEALGAAIIREFDAVCPNTARVVLGHTASIERFSSTKTERASFRTGGHGLSKSASPAMTCTAEP